MNVAGMKLSRLNESGVHRPVRDLPTECQLRFGLDVPFPADDVAADAVGEALVVFVDEHSEDCGVVACAVVWAAASEGAFVNESDVFEHGACAFVVGWHVDPAAVEAEVVENVLEHG